MKIIFLGLFLFVGLVVGENVNATAVACTDITSAIESIEEEFDFAYFNLYINKTAYDVLKNFDDVRPFFLLPSQICDGQKIFTNSSQILVAIRFINSCKNIIAAITYAKDEKSLLKIVRFSWFS